MFRETGARDVYILLTVSVLEHEFVVFGDQASHGVRVHPRQRQRLFLRFHHLTALHPVSSRHQNVIQVHFTLFYNIITLQRSTLNQAVIKCHPSSLYIVLQYHHLTALHPESSSHQNVIQVHLTLFYNIITLQRSTLNQAVIKMSSKFTLHCSTISSPYSTPP